MIPALLSALLVATPAPSAPSANEDVVTPWVHSRAEDLETYLESRVTGRPIPAGQMWRSRPVALRVPDFSPPPSLAPLVRAVRPGVVNISTVNAPNVADGPGPASRSLGSGFIISADGYVVTNNHVIQRAAQIKVKLADGREFLADVVGSDPTTDVALLKLMGSVGELPFTYLGDSDALEVGDWVLAIGNPFGLNHSVAQGIISAKERMLGVGMFDDFLQTDALINPGNSGGPVFNMRGEVVGVASAIVSQAQGLGFAVPINMVKDLLPNLRVNGRLQRGWLGVTIDEEHAEGGATGAVVKDVYKGSPAALAGVAPGDRVLAVNGHGVETYLQLLRRVALLAPGSDVKLTVERAAKKREIMVKLAEQPAPETLVQSGPGYAPELGLVVRDVTTEVSRALGYDPKSGALIVGILPGGGAERAGLRAGDLVLAMGGRRVVDTATFRSALDQLLESNDTGQLVLRVQRGDALADVPVQLTQPE